MVGKKGEECHIFCKIIKESCQVWIDRFI